MQLRIKTITHVSSNRHKVYAMCCLTHHHHLRFNGHFLDESVLACSLQFSSIYCGTEIGIGACFCLNRYSEIIYFTYRY